MPKQDQAVNSTGNHDTIAELNSLKRQKLRDSAILLPVLGVLLFVTPFVSIFTSGDLTGTAFYIFSIWAFLIICAFFLSRTIRQEKPSESEVD